MDSAVLCVQDGPDGRVPGVPWPGIRTVIIVIVLLHAWQQHDIVEMIRVIFRL